MEVVRLQQVKKEYTLGKTIVCALKGIDITVQKGEFLAIAGPSGSGKTTLLNIISAIEKPSSGKAFIDGEDLSLLKENQLADIRAKKLGFIFQSFNLLPVLTALENVEFPLLSCGHYPPSTAREKAARALTEVGLPQHLHHKPLELSGGQRQRVAIARAIATSPSVVLADEPTANLDHNTGAQILNLMKTINQEQQVTFIFSTHDQKVIEIANRVIKLWDGEIQSK